MPAHNFLDLRGQPPFGRLTVLERAANGSDGRVRWLCQCRCGTRCVIDAKALRRGATQSCGCRKNELIAQLNRTHGMAQRAEYHIWKGMKDRCLNPKNTSYVNYGGRGIAICARWQDSFIAFYEDMGPRPDPTYTIERRENNGDYSPENCLWDTLTAQARNKRTSRSLTFNDMTQSLIEWAKDIGMNYHTLYDRLRNGKSIEEALTAPVDLLHTHPRKKRQSKVHNDPFSSLQPPAI